MADETPATGQDEESLEGELPLVRLAPGERFYKFYIFSEPEHNGGEAVQHRIITKEHTDGSLEMVSYNAWFTDGHSEKTDVIRVPSISKDLLDQIVQRVRAQTNVQDQGFREIDFSRCETVEDQVRLLATLDL
mgnify:CR=1 FL=1